MKYNAFNIQELADTLLYELCLEVCRDVERYKNNPAADCHKLNSLVYSEFWRRNKAKYYFEAFNKIANKNSQLNFVL